MVFSLSSSSKSAATRVQLPASDPDASSRRRSSSKSGSAVDVAGPPTPDGGEAATGAAAAASSGSKYWPIQAEVDAVRLLVSEEDREACDMAMANRCAESQGSSGWRRLSEGTAASRAPPPLLAAAQALIPVSRVPC